MAFRILAIVGLVTAATAVHYGNPANGCETDERPILVAIGSLPNLAMVRLHMNQLDHVEDLAHLKPLANLKRLTLMSNPCADKTPDFRYLVCACLPNLKSLDNVLVTKSELKHIADYAASARGIKAMALAPRRSAPSPASVPPPSA